jgi:peptidoglycan/xylan/chitin deacetylase (PgdA/CDA1 family)
MIEIPRGERFARMLIHTSAILTYHSLDSSGSAVSVSPGRFREHVESLMEQQIPVVPLRRVRETPGAVALTFDDGYGNFVDHAVPVLEQYNLTATLFIVSGHCGGLSEWNRASRHKIPTQALLEWRDIAALPTRLIEIGAHTVSHPDLAAMSVQGVTEEMYQCRAQLEDRLGRRVEQFAYPYGSSTPEVRDVAAQLFHLACSTTLDYVTPAADKLNLPRIDTFYLRSNFWFDQLMNPAGRNYITVRRLIRRARACSGAACRPRECSYTRPDLDGGH